MASQCKRKRCADARKRKAVKKKKSGKKRPEQVWKSQTQEIQAQGTLASLLAFVMPYLCAFGEQAADLQSLELFAGKKAISRATQKFGFQACALDKTYSSEDIMDICTEKGFRHALQLDCRLMPGSTCWAAPVCSSWVWVSRSSSGRNARRPQGDTKISWVSQGNLQVKLTVTVLLVAFMRGAYVYIEQPCSSMMELFEPMTSFVKLIAQQKCRVTLGAYGAESAKPMYIYTNDPCAYRLQKKIPKGAEFVQLCTKSENGSVTGIKGVLKASQAYPEDFGKAVASATVSNILNSFGFTDFTN